MERGPRGHWRDERGRSLTVGHQGEWTPEHLLLLAAESCFMSTLLALAAAADITVLGYVSSGHLDVPGDVRLAPSVSLERKLTPMPDTTATLQQYYASPDVTRRMREYCGDAGDGVPTAVYLAGINAPGTPFAAWDHADRRPIDQFTGRVPLDSAVVTSLAALVPDAPNWLQSLPARRPSWVRAGVTARHARAYVGAGMQPHGRDVAHRNTVAALDWRPSR